MPKLPTKIEHLRVVPTFEHAARARAVLTKFGINPETTITCEEGCSHTAVDYVAAQFADHWFDCLRQSLEAHGGRVIGRY